MGKAFLGLLISEDNPFWTATENKGAWEKEMKKGEVYNRFSPATNLLITDYPNIGATEVRSWCHEKVANDWQKFRSTENYNRLAYSSAFPWQADGEKGEVAMNYVLKNKHSKWEALRLFTFKKFENGVYYRDVVLETNEKVKMQLAEMPLPNGVLRVDKYIGDAPIESRLGHYALPKLHGKITQSSRMNKQGQLATIIDNGEYQLAMVELHGNRKMETLYATKLHPQADESMLINVSGEMTPGGIYPCLMLWKKSGEKWSNKELFPVKSVVQNADEMVIEFRNKKIVNIKY
ncbi:MAG: hypothetical protein ACK5JS_08100 [Mangrovibacterium sp.]